MSAIYWIFDHGATGRAIRRNRHTLACALALVAGVILLQVLA